MAPGRTGGPLGPSLGEAPGRNARLGTSGVPTKATPGPHSPPPPPPIPSPGLTEPVQASPPPGRKENGAARSHTGRDGDELRFTSACRVGTFPDWKFRLPGPGCRLIPKRGLKTVSKDETEVRARFPARTAFPDDQSHSEIKHRPGSTESQEAHKPFLLPPLGSCSSLVDKLPGL